MISVDQLTAPLAGSDPCGEDLSLGTSLIELDTLVLGKPETQFGAAEEPDWREVQKRSLKLFEHSRDLRVALALALSLLKTQGLPGLQTGVEVVRGLIEKHWDHVHPKLDPEDSNDPLQRMNLLSVLSAPLGSSGDPMRFIERLREVPLTDSRQVGRFPFGRIYDGKMATDDPAQRLDPAQLDAAFRDTPPEKREALYRAAKESFDHLRGIEAALQIHVSAVQLPNFVELKAALASIQEIIAPYVAQVQATGSGAVADGSPAQDAAPHSGGAQVSSGPAIPGRISNRQDVLRALEQIRGYYQQHEPASPIPLLVRRVERMVPMSFLEIMNEIAPDGVNQVTTIVGPQP